MYSYRLPRLTLYATLAAAIAIVVAIVPARVSAGFAADLHCSGHSHAASRSALRLVQDSGADTDSEVPSDQVEKYVAVYKDMQRDHSLTVDAAAAKQGLTVTEFRELEQKVERDDRRVSTRASNYKLRFPISPEIVLGIDRICETGTMHGVGSIIFSSSAKPSSYAEILFFCVGLLTLPLLKTQARREASAPPTAPRYSFR